MENHILIINTPIQDGDRYLLRLVSQIRTTPELADLPVMLLTAAYPEGLPVDLRDAGVVHRHGTAEHADSLVDVFAERAKYIIVLSEDAYEPRSDSYTLDILDKLNRMKLNGYILAESVLDSNKARFLQLGANAVMRPIRAYPELTVRAISAPGSEQIMENLFTHDGDTACRFDIDVDRCNWGDLACRLIMDNVGTPLGFLDKNDNIVTNPPADEVVNARAVIVMVRNYAAPTKQQIQQSLNALQNLKQAT